MNMDSMMDKTGLLGTPPERGKKIALFSPKSGCGKTTLAVNMAYGLAQVIGSPVVIMDSNISFGDVALFCNTYPKTTIIEAARNLPQLSPSTLGAYLTASGPSLRILASPAKPEMTELVSGHHITSLMGLLGTVFPYVVVDTEPGFHELSLAACEGADIVYIVVAFNTSLGLEHVRRSLTAFRALGYSDKNCKLVISRVPRDIGRLEWLENELSYPVTALLPNDFRLVANAVNTGQPLLATDPASALGKGINDVVRDSMSAVMNQEFSQAGTSLPTRW